MNVTTEHPQVVAIARLAENLAPTVYQALDRINRELQTIGYPDHTPASSPSTAPNPKPEYDQWGRLLPPVTLTTVERGAARRQTLLDQKQQIHDDITTIARIIYSCQTTCANVFGADTPEPTTNKPRCFTGGLAGYLLPRFEADGKTLLPEDVRGWSDPSCTNLPRRGDTGPCDACLMRHRRWRTRAGLKPLADQIEAA